MKKMTLLTFICLIQMSCEGPTSPLIFKSKDTKLEEIIISQTPTYLEISKSILAPKCLHCHSKAEDNVGSGNVNLETEESVISNLKGVRTTVENNQMPIGRIKLTKNEKEKLYAWIDSVKSPEVEFISYEMVKTSVIQPRCLGCHSEESGNVGGVNLETYEQVVANVNSIEIQIKSGGMPRPRTRPLTDQQKDLILKWIANGAPL